jgi:general secretion pathway protein G
MTGSWRAARMARPGQAGYSLVELLAVTVVLLVLASAVMPLAKVSVQRVREAELRRSLREIRTAIDRYKDAADLQQIAATDLKAGAEGYPPSLEVLVEGVRANGDASGRKLKFLRRVPFDPMTRTQEWGMRSYQDDADSTSWGGQNVYDVYTESEGLALDGTKYVDW